MNEKSPTLSRLQTGDVWFQWFMLNHCATKVSSITYFNFVVMKSNDDSNEKVVRNEKKWAAANPFKAATFAGSWKLHRIEKNSITTTAMTMGLKGTRRTPSRAWPRRCRRRDAMHRDGGRGGFWRTGQWRDSSWSFASLTKDVRVKLISSLCDHDDCIQLIKKLGRCGRAHAS